MSLYTIGCTVSAATTLQIPQLLKMCMDFLLAELNLTTCVYVWNIAAAYGLLPVRDAARRFVLENFVPLSETLLFNQLTLEQISAFLRDDSLVLPSEVVAFQVRVQSENRDRSDDVTCGSDTFHYVVSRRGSLGWCPVRRCCFIYGEGGPYCITQHHQKFPRQVTTPSTT